MVPYFLLSTSPAKITNAELSVEGNPLGVYLDGYIPNPLMVISVYLRAEFLPSLTIYVVFSILNCFSNSNSNTSFLIGFFLPSE